MRSTRVSATSVGIHHPAIWPYRQLDVAALRGEGWEPTPFREFVLKVHQLCNLACDYCYVYEMADQSWRDRPKLMSTAVWQAAARRIAEHVRDHRLTQIGVILHGGEPLLAGPDRLLRLIADVRAAIPESCTVDIGMQTNGVLLTENVATRLADAGVRIGVSLDGTAESHDRRRRFRNGAGSHAALERALDLLRSPRLRPAFAGILCTVDVDADPVDTYESLLRHRPPHIDLLLPHANWASPPYRPAGRAEAYGRWLIEVFDRWYSTTSQETGIRLFEEIMDLVLGGYSRSEQVGLSPIAVAVVESDGSIEQVDSLKSAYPGACVTGSSVLTDPFDSALEHPGVVARQIGIRALSAECIECPVHRLCGAGHYAHRYRPGDGFRHPTVYCDDMLVLIGHIRRRLTADHPEIGT